LVDPQPTAETGTVMSLAERTDSDLGERFFKELADNAPVMIWRSGPDKQCDWFNKPWLDFVGRTMDGELGNGWAENVHPEDFERCLDIYVNSFDARKPFSMIYRLRRAGGMYRQILDNGAPFCRGGEFARYWQLHRRYRTSSGRDTVAPGAKDGSSRQTDRRHRA
jgi:PAS domain-containing protein